MKKYILYTLLVSFIIGAWFGYSLIWGKPLNIDHFFGRIDIQGVLANPEGLSSAGIIENTILDFHSGKLTDASPEHRLKTFERNKKNLATLQRYNREELSGQKAISYDIMEWRLTNRVDGEPWLFYGFPVTQMGGVHRGLPVFMENTHRVIHEKSARRYIERLEAFKTKFGQITESVNYRAEIGVIPPILVFDHVLTQMYAFVSMPPQENPLYTGFESKIDALPEIPDDLKSSLKEDVIARIQTHVYPGYQILIEAMENLRDSATADVGVWTLPNGDEYYRHRVRSSLTLDMEPDTIHAIGLAEVERIQVEMEALFDQLGITEGTVSERFAALETLPDMFYPEEETSFDQIIKDYTAMVELLYEETAPLFNRLPASPIEVRRVPEFTEATAPSANYTPPSLDGRRPGIFFRNLRNLNEIPKYGMMTLSAHEAVPGHHFQVALQREIENVPSFRQLNNFTAFAEGWALYAERLVWEAGVYKDDPLGDLGRLQAEMFRAVRLVVDTGIHLKRWTREEAIAYMLEHTGMHEDQIISEVERYIVMPGQALAYKIGMMHIQNLRSQAESTLGERFDLARFHDVILMNGSLPLQVLTRVVENYIEAELAV